MRHFLYRNGLSLVLFTLFALSLVGQVLTGWHAYNEDRHSFGAPALTLPTYLKSGHFVSALFENWESEFLQMGAYVVLTIFLRQQGSPESKPLDGEVSEDEDPREREGELPAAVRQRGPMMEWLYANSLSFALGALFLLSFSSHSSSSLAFSNSSS